VEQHLEQLGHVDARTKRQCCCFGGRHHLCGVDQVVAQLDDLTHARTTHVHDESRHGLERGAHAVESGGLSTHHERERSLLSADRAARHRGVEVASAGRGDPLVLSSFDVGIDGGAVDHRLAGTESGEHRVEHLHHVG
jgi:hypothetical protein